MYRIAINTSTHGSPTGVSIYPVGSPPGSSGSSSSSISSPLRARLTVLPYGEGKEYQDQRFADGGIDISLRIALRIFLLVIYSFACTLDRVAIRGRRSGGIDGGIRRKSIRRSGAELICHFPIHTECRCGAPSSGRCSGLKSAQRGLTTH